MTKEKEIEEIINKGIEDEDVEPFADGNYEVTKGILDKIFLAGQNSQKEKDLKIITQWFNQEINDERMKYRNFQLQKIQELTQKIKGEK